MPNRKKALLIFGITGALFFIIFGVTLSPASKNEKITSQTASITSSPVPLPTQPPVNNQTSTKVVKVIDGDTVNVQIGAKIETIRLIGIDSPEARDPRMPVQCFGAEASSKAKELLDGKNVLLEADPTQGEKDKYNRLLRYIFLEDGTNINKLMITEGFANEYTYNLPYKYQSEFKQAEREAREGKKGLWADDACALTPTTSKVQSSSTTQTTTNLQPQTGGFTCSGKTKCAEMTTCAEASFYLNTCGVSRLDGDKDGVPCESLCR